MEEKVEGTKGREKLTLLAPRFGGTTWQLGTVSSLRGTDVRQDPRRRNSPIGSGGDRPATNLPNGERGIPTAGGDGACSSAMRDCSTVCFQTRAAAPLPSGALTRSRKPIRPQP